MKNPGNYPVITLVIVSQLVHIIASGSAWYAIQITLLLSEMPVACIFLKKEHQRITSRYGKFISREWSM